MDQRKSKQSRVAVSSTASQKKYKPLRKQASSKERATTTGKLAKIVMVIVFLGIAIGFIGMSGVFRITMIEVEGNSILSEEQIISFSGLEKGMNLFAISSHEILEKVKENPYIDTVQIKRCLPDKVKLVVEERQPEYALPLANSFIYINRKGYILEISNKAPSVPIILGCTTDLSNIKEKDQLEENDLQKMSMVIKIMESACNQKMEDWITKIDISNEENYTLYLENQGKIAYLGTGTELNTRFLYIKAILKEQQGKTGKIFVNVDLNEEYVYFREEPI